MLEVSMLDIGLGLLQNGVFRGILALIVISGVLVIFGVAVQQKNEKMQEQLLQTLRIIVVLVIAFYFVESDV